MASSPLELALEGLHGMAVGHGIAIKRCEHEVRKLLREVPAGLEPHCPSASIYVDPLEFDFCEAAKCSARVVEFLDLFQAAVEVVTSDGLHEADRHSASVETTVPNKHQRTSSASGDTSLDGLLAEFSDQYKPKALMAQGWTKSEIQMLLDIWLRRFKVVDLSADSVTAAVAGWPP